MIARSDCAFDDGAFCGRYDAFLFAIINGDGTRAVGHDEMFQARTTEIKGFAPERIVIKLWKIAFRTDHKIRWSRHGSVGQRKLRRDKAC